MDTFLFANEENTSCWTLGRTVPSLVVGGVLNGAPNEDEEATEDGGRRSGGVREVVLSEDTGAADDDEAMTNIFPRGLVGFDRIEASACGFFPNCNASTTDR